jgi:hypothetical protein
VSNALARSAGQAQCSRRSLSGRERQHGHRDDKKDGQRTERLGGAWAICLNYLEGATLEERFVGPEPDAVGKTLSDVLNNLNHEAAAAILNSMIAMGTQPWSTYTRRPVALNRCE